MGNLKVPNKVLIVDDYRDIRVFLKKCLDHWGFATCTACNGQVALKVFQRETPDLLISDLEMPHMNGFELTRQVRAVSNIPIVIMSAGSDYMRDGREAAFDAGADAFLMKPFELDEMRGQIKILLAMTEPR